MATHNALTYDELVEKIGKKRAENVLKKISNGDFINEYYSVNYRLKAICAKYSRKMDTEINAFFNRNDELTGVIYDAGIQLESGALSPFSGEKDKYTLNAIKMIAPIGMEADDGTVYHLVFNGISSMGYGQNNDSFAGNSYVIVNYDLNNKIPATAYNPDFLELPDEIRAEITKELQNAYDLADELLNVIYQYFNDAKQFKQDVLDYGLFTIAYEIEFIGLSK